MKPIWILKIKKWWITKVIWWAYRTLPFNIAYCEYRNDKSYEMSHFKGNHIFAEFDVIDINRHYIIYK